MIIKISRSEVEKEIERLQKSIDNHRSHMNGLMEQGDFQKAVEHFGFMMSQHGRKNMLERIALGKHEMIVR